MEILKLDRLLVQLLSLDLFNQTLDGHLFDHYSKRERISMVRNRLSYILFIFPIKV
ncbi:hypothetical protein LguiA_006590 [Lonicera macranthoides]